MSQLFLLFEMLISPILRLAFADMMNMSFDQLRGHVQQNTAVMAQLQWAVRRR